MVAFGRLQKIGLGFFAMLLILASLLLFSPVPSAHAIDNGWATAGNNAKVYYKDGKKLTGIQKIGKAYYCFSDKGALKVGTAKLGSMTVYTNEKGQLEAYKKGGSFYKPNGKKLSKIATRDYKALLSARKVLKQVTKESDSKSTKMYKCMKWVNKGNYHIYREFKLVKGWASNYANDHFQRRINGYRFGDCVSDPCAFAFLCLAIGYTDVSVGTGQVRHAHGTTRVNGKYYDPLFAESKSFSKYYGHADKYWITACKLSAPTYANNYTVCSYSGKVKPSGLNLRDEVSDKSGLVKIDGARYFYEKGKKVTSKWITVGKYSYYFKGNGKAAVGSVKAKKNGVKAYYVFDKNGHLLTGNKTRSVKVKGIGYRVSKSGKAQSGWQKIGGRKYLYAEDGQKVTGPCVYKKKVFVLDGKGKLDSKKTAAVRKLMVRYAPCEGLVGLLGAPKKVSTNNSCLTLPGTDSEGNAVEMNGTDKAYRYNNMTLCTFVADKANGDGKEYFVLAY